jgi:hypothetical protein
MALLTYYSGSNDDFENNGTTSATAGQSFQVDSNGTCSHVAIYGARGNTASGTFKVELKTGSPTGTVIATTGTLTTTSTLTLFANGPMWNWLALTTPVALTTGTTYYMVATSLTGSTNDEIRWSVDNTSPSYANGTYYDGSTADSGKDRSFGISTLAPVALGNSGSTFNNTSNSTSETWAFTCSSDSLLTVFVETDFDASPSATYNGVSMTLVDSQIDNSGSNMISAFKLINPASGSNNIVVSKTNSWVGILAASWKNVDTITPTGTTAKTSGNGTSPTVTITSEPADMGVSVVFGNNPTSFTGNNNQTVIVGPSFNPGLVDLGYVLGGTALGWTLNTTQSYAEIGFAIKSGVSGTAYSVAAAVGSFTLSGIAVNLNYARQMVAAVGSFTLTGVAVTFRTGKGIVADVGSFILTGVSALLRFSGWSNQSKNQTTYGNQSKNNATWTNQSKSF